MSNQQFQHDFFTEETSVEPSPLAQKAGAIGTWLLHLAKVAFLVYSGVHGVMASLKFASESGFAQLAQIVGIIITEAVLFGLYLAWHNQRITGAAQSIAAGITYVIGFTLATLGIIVDSQINSGLALTPFLANYLAWGLPIAPAIMAAGALLTHELAPHQLMARQVRSAQQAHEEAVFQAHMAAQWAELEAKKALANMQLNARRNVVSQIASAYNQPRVQEAITQTAIDNLPQLLVSAGIQNIAHQTASAQSDTAASPQPTMTADTTISNDTAVEQSQLEEDNPLPTQSNPSLPTQSNPSPSRNGHGH